MDKLIQELKEEIIEVLNLEDMEANEIGDDDALFGDGLGLDSIDALELIVLLEKNYGIKIKDPKKGKDIFYSVRTMAELLLQIKNSLLCERKNSYHRNWDYKCIGNDCTREFLCPEEFKIRYRKNEVYQQYPSR